MSEAQGQMQEAVEVQRELLLRQAVERHVSQLIETGANAVQTLKPPPGKQSRMEESQFRNVLNVAMETSSVDVITNFIRYQIGRDREKWSAKDADFGPTLIRDIETGAVRKAAEEVRQEVSLRIEAVSEADVFDRAYLRLTRLYLGYAMRILYYCKKREEAEDRHVREKAWENLYRAKEGEQSAA